MNRKLKAAIIGRFGTQYAFADAAGVHESQVSRFIRNRPPHPSKAMKTRLAALLEVEVDVFETNQRGAEE